MTAALFLNPVDACAIANGITTVVGLGDIDLTCPTCEGSHYLRCEPPDWPVANWTPCPNCTKGQIAPVSGWYLIGATTERPEIGVHYGDLSTYVLPPGFVLGNNDDQIFTIKMGALVAYANIEILPVESTEREFQRNASQPHIVRIGDGLTLWPRPLSPFEAGRDITSSLPYGVYRPGGYAALVTEITPTMVCPECEGEPPLLQHRIEGGSKSCRYCNRKFTFNMMRDHGPFRCSCQRAREAACSTCHSARRLTFPFPVDAPDKPSFKEIQL